MSKQLLNKHPSRQTVGEVWSQYLQRHVMRLLLLRDQQLFRGKFCTFFTGSRLPEIPLLQFYDNHIKLLVFSDELLDDILPRIRRQLSLQTNQISLQEEAPTRGEIDWQRTITRTINEAPDQPPLRFDTRQRQQHTSVPENVLFVALLLHLRRIVQHSLKKDQSDELLANQERQQLVSIDERIERELAAPYIRVLVEEASRSDIDTLVEHVTTRLRPGVSPYRDLLTWWEQFDSLHIGQASDSRHLALTSNRRNEQMDSWLYELWIALELITWLQEKRLISPDTMEIQNDQLHCTFTWNNQYYRFRYCRQLSPVTGTMSGWEQVPAIQPSYVIEREEPTEIKYGDTIIWREPPFVMMGSYATDGEAETSLGDSMQKILGSMQLRSAHSGALFFPLLPDPVAGRQFTSEVKRDGKVYTDGAAKDTNIHLYKITPDMPNSLLQERLSAVIEHAITCLPKREKPACHGMMLDPDNVNANRDSIQVYNVLCPKPHIGKGVFDLVNRDKHCLKDPHLCHVIGQSIMTPFVIRTTTSKEMMQQSSALRTHSDEMLRQAEQQEDEEKAEQLRSHIFIGVGSTVERYVKLYGDTKANEAKFEAWVFGNYWKKHQRCLSEETRNILLSSEYVWDEYQRTPTLADWAAPAIQYCRALENEIKRRIHDYYPTFKEYYSDVDQKGFDRHLTLGALETICKFKDEDLHYAKSKKDIDKIKSAQHNWPLCKAIITNSQSDIKAFEDILWCMVKEKVSNNRNELAHGGPISQSIAQELRDAILGYKGKIGILCWLVEYLEPKK